MFPTVSSTLSASYFIVTVGFYCFFSLFLCLFLCFAVAELVSQMCKVTVISVCMHLQSLEIVYLKVYQVVFCEFFFFLFVE